MARRAALRQLRSGAMLHRAAAPVPHPPPPPPLAQSITSYIVELAASNGSLIANYPVAVPSTGWTQSQQVEPPLCTAATDCRGATPSPLACCLSLLTLHSLRSFPALLALHRASRLAFPCPPTPLSRQHHSPLATPLADVAKSRHPRAR